MPRWTKEQDEVLIENANKGAEYIASAINKKFGLHRTAHAVRNHASRLGISLMQFSICPECGRVGYPLNRLTGLCPICSTEARTEQHKQFQKVLRMEVRRIEDDPDYKRAVREGNRVRQQNSRICKKYGLPSMSERQFPTP